MRKRRIAVELFAMMIAVTGVFHGSMNVNAATKKITVDQTYENATKIKGKTKKGCVVKVKIGKKTYQSKVNKKGNYSVKVSKLKLGKKYTCDEILSTLKEYEFADIQGQGFIPIYESTKLTDDLHKVVGFETDYEFITKRKMKEIQKLSKQPPEK